MDVLYIVPVYNERLNEIVNFWDVPRQIYLSMQ